MKNTFRALPVLVSFALAPVLAQTPYHDGSLPDRSWLKADAGNISAITSDPRYMRLLTAALPQRQWFWYDHGRFLTVPQLAETFLGIPTANTGDLTENRYLTITGCVPHVCTIGGMLWIDTAPAQTGIDSPLIFAAAPSVGLSSSHLWLFVSSDHFNWQHSNHDFQKQLGKWLGTLRTGLPAPDDRQHVTMLTFVYPNGRQDDRTLEDLLPQQPGAPR